MKHITHGGRNKRGSMETTIVWSTAILNELVA